VDVFHDAEDAVIRSSETDVATLEATGYSVRRELWTPSFRRAWVAKNTDGVKLEWCHDSAWRFFPIETDELLGWRLHWFDAITNKALAMGGRAETRDLVDIVAYADRCPLHAVIWAACSKDPGFGPLLLLSQMRRHSRVNIAELREIPESVPPSTWYRGYLNGYGDPARWTTQTSATFTALSWLNTTKYPPSLLFLLMTLGPALLLLATFDRGTPSWLRPAVVFGKVPMLYYVMHFTFIHLLAVVACLARYGSAHWMFESPDLAHYPFSPPPGWGYSLPVVYLIWIVVVIAMFPVCRWFAALKQRRKDAWLSYL